MNRRSTGLTAGFAALGAAIAFFCAGLSAAPRAQAQDAAFHMQTFTKLSGDFAGKHNVTWESLARYIDYLDVDQRGANAAHAAGIKVGFYTDVHLLCKGSSCSGNPGVDALSEANFAHDCAHRRVYSSDDSPAVKKLLSDPNAPALEHTFADVIAGMRDNQYGHFSYDFVFDDDVFIPRAPWFPWHGGSPRAATLPLPYCGYSDAGYIAGVKHLEAHAALPIIFNGLNGRPNITYIQQAPNVLGGMCEDCLHVSYDASRDREAAPIWNQEIDAGLAAAARKKLWIVYPHGEVSNPTQGYVYASLMLVYAPGSTTLDEDVQTPSGVPLPPTILLVPQHPLGRAALHSAELQRPGGAYAREFGSCSIGGLALGPCAAVVNPDAGRSVPYPFPANRYTHTLLISGAGVIREMGDTGMISPQGPPPPREIAPRGWSIVFR